MKIKHDKEEVSSPENYLNNELFLLVKIRTVQLNIPYLAHSENFIATFVNAQNTS